ncbi:hypothetical protein H101_08165, partial [Trichophyton interdigitale H6]
IANEWINLEVILAPMNCLSPTYVRTRRQELVEHEYVLKQLMILMWPLEARVDAGASMHLPEMSMAEALHSRSGGSAALKEYFQLAQVVISNSSSVNINPQSIKTTL